MNAISVGIIVFLFLIMCYVFYFLIMDLRFNNKLSGSLYKTAVGRANTKGDQNTLKHTSKGDDLILSCPKGRIITIDNIYIGGNQPNGLSDKDTKKCWIALSKAGPGYPQSGTENNNKKYQEYLQKIKKEHDGKESSTIKNDDKNLMNIIDLYLDYYDELKDCDSKSWSPLVTVKYECVYKN